MSWASHRNPEHSHDTMARHGRTSGMHGGGVGSGGQDKVGALRSTPCDVRSSLPVTIEGRRAPIEGRRPREGRLHSRHVVIDESPPLWRPVITGNVASKRLNARFAPARKAFSRHSYSCAGASHDPSCSRKEPHKRRALSRGTSATGVSCCFFGRAKFIPTREVVMHLAAGAPVHARCGPLPPQIVSNDVACDRSRTASRSRAGKMDCGRLLYRRHVLRIGGQGVVMKSCFCFAAMCEWSRYAALS